MKSILWKVAKEHHTTEEEVRSAIDEAIAIAMQNEDPAVKALWASIPRKGAIPTAEEFILWAALRINSDSM